jgi:transposase-like protein
MAKPLSRFFSKVLKAGHTQSPRVITVDKNAAYPKAMETLKGDETRSRDNRIAAKEVLEPDFSR